METRPWAYGCSPFGHNPLTGQVATRAEMAEHTALAQQLPTNRGQVARAIWEDGYFPIVPHLYAPQFLDDHEPTDRAYALEWGLKLLGRCQVLYLYDAMPSTVGMQHEIAWALAHDLPIRGWRPAIIGGNRQPRGRDDCVADSL